MENRKELLKRASNFKTVPGHGPNIEKMSDEQLKNYVEMLEMVFEDLFGRENEQ